MTAASASTPARQSSRSAYSAGECETPVGLRTKSIAVGTPGRGEDAGVMAGAGRQHRCAAEHAARADDPLAGADVELRARR